MKTLLGYIKILVVFGIIGYSVATAYYIKADKKSFDDYRTSVCLKGLTLQDAYDAIKNGEANTHTKVNYGIKPYITYVYNTKLKSNK